jgi:Tol biopolymer transport system component
MINEDGTGLEQLTYDGVFDSFPMFSPNGKKLCSHPTAITVEPAIPIYLLLIGWNKILGHLALGH